MENNKKTQLNFCLFKSNYLISRSLFGISNVCFLFQFLTPPSSLLLFLLLSFILWRNTQNDTRAKKKIKFLRLFFSILFRANTLLNIWYEYSCWCVCGYYFIYFFLLFSILSLFIFFCVSVFYVFIFEYHSSRMANQSAFYFFAYDSRTRQTNTLIRRVIHNNDNNKGQTNERTIDHWHTTLQSPTPFFFFSGSGHIFLGKIAR